MFLRRYGPVAFFTVLLILLYGSSQEERKLMINTQSSAHACAASPETPLKIVPTGDSITEGEGSSDRNGYRLFLHQHLMADCAGRSVEFVGTQNSGSIPDPSIPSLTQTEGYSGWDIERLLNFSMDAIADSLAQQPNVMLLHIGTNNVAPIPLRPPGIVEPSQAPEKLEELLDQLLKRAPNIVLIVAQIITSPNFGWKDNIPHYNAAIPGMVRRRRAKGYKIVSVDMSSVGEECVRNFDGSDVVCDDIIADGVHPKDAGYRKMAKLWYEALVEATERGYFAPPKS